MSRVTEIANHVAKGGSGTFTGIVQKRVGFERGKKGEKIRYGDAVVSEVIITGFSYRRLLERSIQAAAGDVFWSKVAAELWKKHPAVAAGLTGNEIFGLIDEQVASWQSSLTPEGGKNETWFKPLEIDGTKVIGAKVYTGEGVTDGTGAIGEIYLSGLRISSKVLVEPPNGYGPAKKSGAKAIVKGIVRNLTPISRYKSYRLSPDEAIHLRIGGSAAVYAEQIGMEISDKVVAFLAGLED